jgi:hypothetical protein
MRKLPKKLRKEGFDLELVERKGHVCIYRHHLPFNDEDNDDYEVVIPNLYNRDFNGNKVETYESYPGTNQWGSKGFTIAGGKWNPVSQMVERTEPGVALSRAKTKMNDLLATTEPPPLPK